MQITTITYSRKFGRANYGSEGLDLTASCGPEESPTAVAFILKAIVHARLEDKQVAREYLTAAYEAQDNYIAPEGYTRLSPDVQHTQAMRDGHFYEV